jgi:hypothetical protein
MKKTFTFFLLLFSSFVFAQTDYSTISLKTTADCKKAEPTVLEAAKLVLSKPISDASAHDANVFILTWMTNCEYSFLVDDKIGKLDKPKGNKNLLFIYMACQSKFLLENIDKAKDQNAIALGAYSLLADYISNTSNGVTINKDVQKFLDAKKEGKLQQWLDAK